MAIEGYNLFRRDRQGRKGGGVAIYVRRSLAAAEWPLIPALDPVYEMLWVKVQVSDAVTYIGALYHPPKPIYQTADLINHVEAAVFRIQQECPRSKVILAGDLNTLSDTEIVIRTGMTSVVSQPTRGNNLLDRVYLSDFEYDAVKVKVVKSAVKSDHQAIVVHNGDTIMTANKTRRVCMFRKHTSAEHANFLAGVSMSTHLASSDGGGELQDEVDRLYVMLNELLDQYYPLRTVTITSADPPFITPSVKYMLRCKNKLMRAGRLEQSAALAVKIGAAIKQFNSAELCRVDVIADPRSMWAKVRQLTGRCSNAGGDAKNSTVTADMLNKHYAAISTDAN